MANVKLTTERRPGTVRGTHSQVAGHPSRVRNLAGIADEIDGNFNRADSLLGFLPHPIHIRASLAAGFSVPLALQGEPL
jgi:hypothetical protein